MLIIDTCAHRNIQNIDDDDDSCAILRTRGARALSFLVSSTLASRPAHPVVKMSG
jgi:hypothetical protein